MRALDRKLLRDLRQMWSQALTIALVVASGIGGFVATLSAVDSLDQARARFYATGRFADVFATVKRAPLALVETLRALPGVADVQVSVEQAVRVDLEGVADPIVGQLIGVDRRVPLLMNRVSLRGGALPNSLLRGADERADQTLLALVNEGFAQARGLRPGDRVGVLLNGKRRSLVIAGIALSPEYIFAGFAGMPDLRGFGVFWVDREALAAAYDMEGAFNRAAFKLAPGASEAAVIAAVSGVLAPYGGREATGRSDQSSHAMLDNEIQEQRVLGTVLPAIFLAVSAFLLSVVVSRLIATQREQIAALKALGYPNRTIAAHYLKLVLAIVCLGLVLGVLLGKWLGAMLAGLYGEFFHFAAFEHRLEPALVLISAAICVVTAVAGTLNAIAAAVRLAPAEAMRPPAPGRFRRAMIERVLASLRLPPPTPVLRMILRNMERRPVRTALSVGGVAAAVAIVMLGNFFRDAVDEIVTSSFTRALRGDVIVWLAEAADAGAVREIARLPGAVQVEAGRDVVAHLVHGQHSERVALQGVSATPHLRRIVDLAGSPTTLRGAGLVLTDRLAAKLQLQPGQTLRLEVLEGRRRMAVVRLDAVVQEMMGLNAYIERRALNALLGEGDIVNNFAVGLEAGREAEFLVATKELPRVAGAFSKAALWRNMQDITARNIRIMSTILTAFAVVIAVGVVYNNARIALAERTWELASLRVLGFTRAEVSTMLLGEQAIAIALALPLGMLLGLGLTHLIVELLQTDQFHFPVVMQPRTYAWAACSVVVAAMVTAWVVRRRIDQLDLVAALKTHE